MKSVQHKMRSPPPTSVPDHGSLSARPLPRSRSTSRLLTMRLLPPTRLAGAITGADFRPFIRSLGAGSCHIERGCGHSARDAFDGARQNRISDLVRLFVGREMTDEQVYALWTVRLPASSWASWLVGVLRSLMPFCNPLADPGLFGLSQGAITMVMVLAFVAPGAPRELIAFAAAASRLGGPGPCCLCLPNAGRVGCQGRRSADVPRSVDPASREVSPQSVGGGCCCRG